MAEALVNLEYVLSSPQVKLTPVEKNVLLKCKSEALRGFMTGALVGGTVGLATTWKLSKFARVYVSGGTAASLGLWMFNRSIDSCLDRILELDGSRLQRELANLFLKKYQNDPLIMQRVYKHFYSERVFDDSTSDKPVLRWRYRNFFGDNVAHGQGTNDSDSPSELNVVSHNESDTKKDPLESKQVTMNCGAEVMEDPLDSLFECMAPVEEIHHPSSLSTPATALTRGHRRSHRRRRMLHRESLKQAQPQQI